MGKQILTRGGDQFGRANDPDGAIQKNFFECAFGGLHWKNVNMVQAAKQAGL